jgi:hydrogenase maturation protease
MNSATRIIGIGSHHGVDRLGWLLCDLLKNIPWQEEVDIQACRTPAQLPELLSGCDSAIVLDAVITGQVAGQIIALGMDELEHHSCSYPSSHGFGITEALELARVLEQLPKALKIFGISVTDALQDADEVSRKALPGLQKAICEFQHSLKH